MNAYSPLIPLLLALGIPQALHAKSPKTIGPPEAAIKACEHKSAGTEVSFMTPRGRSIQARCTRVQKQLVAIPFYHLKHKKGAQKSSYDD